MRLDRLALRNFRNYEELSLAFDPGVNLIVGDNAQGKTNLLEAIAYLGSGKSFRAQKTSEMIRFGADFADLEGDIFAQERKQSLRSWIPGLPQGKKSLPQLPALFPSDLWKSADGSRILHPAACSSARTG